MSDPDQERARNLTGAGWLVADMSLNIFALSIVKAMGADYPAVQIVVLRVAVGLVVILPWVWRDRAIVLDHIGGSNGRLALHLTRVALSALTLSASFFAIARVPFAVFTAINFTRPILLMVLAALLLGERISRGRWRTAAVAFAGALIAAAPMGASGVAGGWGTAALCLAVVCGTLAIILTRRLKGTPEVVMMLFYTAGIGVILLPFAAWAWVPVAPHHWPILLAVGVFAQFAQLCFLRAHWMADAGVLGSVSYLSLVLSTFAGWALFNELPGWPLVVGALVIVAANVAIRRQL